MSDFIANGLSDLTMGTKLVLRSGIWFGLGYHNAAIAGDDKAYLDTLRKAVLASGKAKSEASRRVKVAKAMGAAFQAKFASELASEWASPAHMVQACYTAMTASGVSSEVKMLDWIKYGDADYTAKKKAREQEAALDAAKAASQALLDQAAQAAQMDIDATVKPVGSAAAPVEGSKLEPVPFDPVAVVDGLSVKDQDALAAYLAEVIANRKAPAAKQKKAA